MEYARMNNHVPSQCTQFNHILCENYALVKAIPITIFLIVTQQITYWNQEV
jgi:hypothetical protein